MGAYWAQMDGGANSQNTDEDGWDYGPDFESLYTRIHPYFNSASPKQAEDQQVGNVAVALSNDGSALNNDGSALNNAGSATSHDGSAASHYGSAASHDDMHRVSTA
jgi:hypothetical protein